MQAVKLFLVALLGRPAAASRNKFGIGVYTDTEPVTPYERQLDDASSLVGRSGFVTLYLCAWRTQSPARSCMNESTVAIDAADRAMLLDAYAKNLSVVVRLGNPYVVRDHADDATHTRYTRLAAAYAPG